MTIYIPADAETSKDSAIYQTKHIHLKVLFISRHCAACHRRFTPSLEVFMRALDRVHVPC